jgi:tight adherence protein B
VAQLWLGWPLVSLLFGVCGVGLPAARYAPRARRQRAAEQAALVDFAAQLRSLLGSGGTSSVEVAFARLARFGPVALRPELARTVRDARRLRGGFPEALDRLRERLADQVGDQVVAASRHSYRLGGRGLGPVLDSLVESSRQTQDVRREAEGRRTQAYLAAGVLCVLPALALVAVRTIAPEYLAMYDDPSGQLWLLGSAVWLAIGVGAVLWAGRLPKAERIFP